MRFNGNKVCPHCKFKHSLFQPFSRPYGGWKCPQCGRLLKTERRRHYLVLIVPLVALFVMLGFCETTVHRLFAISIAWFGVGSFVEYLALDVRAADS